MVDLGLREFISASHWQWQLAECFQSLDLQVGQVLLGNASDAILALQPGAAGTAVSPAALCWEPSPAELKRLGRLARLVVAARPWRWQDWPLPKPKGPQKEEMEMCHDLREAGFHLTGLRVATYHCEISLPKWLQLLAERYSAAELKKLREEMQEPDGSEKYLHFQDRLLLLICELPQTSSCCLRRAKRPRLPATPSMSLAMPWRWRLALDGFWAPLVPLTPQEAAEALRKLDQHAQQVVGPAATAEDLVGEQRFKLHLLYPWAAQLVRHPVILEAVREALGAENVLVWFSEVNAKGARSPCHAAPHQDGIFASLAPNDAVITVWLALTEAPAEMGGLYFHRGSHLRGPLPHQVDPEAENLIGFRVSGDASWAEEEATPVELKAGEASLHSFRTLHWSGPNLTASRRVGLAVRYVRADVQRSRKLRRRESAMVACGHYDPKLGAFDVEAPPVHPFGFAEVAQHSDALARERENYWADEAA